MRIICSWCKSSMGDKEPLDDERITHGICAACYQAQLAEIEAAKPVEEWTSETVQIATALAFGYVETNQPPTPKE